MLFIACDDGDRILTNFNFDVDSDLKFCQAGNGNNVFYIVNSNPDEAIAFNFVDEDFDGTYAENDISQSLSIDLGDNNRLIFRTFDTSIGNGNAYFCSGIPPTEYKVIQEYKNKDGGTIELTTYLVDEEIDEFENTVTRYFETYATAYDVTLKNVKKDEEIVEEIINLGYFERSAVFDLSEVE